MKTYLRIKAVLLLTILGISHVFCQTGSISGIITDKETKGPISGVTVSIEKLNSHTHTNEAGYFSFSGLTEGPYEIDLSKLGYDSRKINVILKKTESHDINISMLFNPIILKMIDIEADRPVSAASSKYLNKIDFINRPKNSAQDLLKLVPGLFIAQHAGGGKAEQIFIRGFDCDHGTDVATFVDGIPVNLPSHGHGQGYEDLHFLIPETVKGMDIFKGPYAPQFGDFATGAAVEFNTLDTLENNLIQIEGGSVPRHANISSKRVLGMIQIPISSSKISSYLATEIINNRSYFESDQHFNRFNIFSKTTLNINDHSTLNLTGSGFSSSWDASGQLPERAVNSESITRFGSIDNTEGGTTSRNILNLVYKSSLSSGDFMAQVFSSEYNFKLFSNFTFFLDDPLNGDQIEQDDKRKISGMNINYSFRNKLGRMNNKFTAGALIRSDNIENQLWHSVKRKRLEVRANANIDQRSSAVYFNEAFHVNDHLRIEIGGRYDYIIFNVEDLIQDDSVHNNYSGYNYQALFNPKLNVAYTFNKNFQLFINAGSGYHSNDARSSVQETDKHRLPRSIGAEIGTLAHIGEKLSISAALWELDLENELVYVGDDGTTENKGSSRRTGIDISLRWQVRPWIFADADFNLSKNVFTDTLFGKQKEVDQLVPLAPTLTSAGGITIKFTKALEGGLRYRLMADRPANESGSVTAHGYNIIDLMVSYKLKHLKLGLTIENLLNEEWNEAQFNTESRLQFENKPVEELHFTPGTPFYSKLAIGYTF